MCDRIGCMHFPKLRDMDFSGAPAASRRKFLKGATAAMTITMGMGGMMGTAHAAGGIKSTHGSGFCNLNIFLAHSRQYSKAAGPPLALTHPPTAARMETRPGLGQTD